MKILEIRVLRELRRIKLLIEMPDPARYVTSQVPHLPIHLLRLLPHLAAHDCDNGSGKTFREECRDTEIPHLFEHLIMELQWQAQYAEVMDWQGATEWNWYIDPRGLFSVHVNYENEILAVGAIHLAQRIIQHLDQRNLEALDIDLEIARLRDIARLGRELMGVQGASLAFQSTPGIASGSNFAIASASPVPVATAPASL